MKLCFKGWSPFYPYSQGTKINHGYLQSEEKKNIFFSFLCLDLFVGILAGLELKVTYFWQLLLSMHLLENPIV